MFKPMTQKELEEFAQSLEALLGARFQEVKTSDQVLGLGFYWGGRTHWLIVDLTPARPFALLVGEFPAEIKTRRTPVELFLRAHCVSHKMSGAWLSDGRVMHLQLGPSEIEIRLIPHATNFIATTGEKKISWSKVVPLKGQSAVPQALREEDSRPRDEDLNSERIKEWLSLWQSQGGAKKSPTLDLAKVIEKKQKALAELERRLENPLSKRWRDFGDWLKTHQSLDVPEEFQEFLQPKSKLAAHIQLAFENAQKWEVKEEGTRNRITALKKELLQLESRGADGMESKKGNQAKEEGSKKLMWDPKSKGRRIPLGDGIELYIGRSAKDNLALLRKANAWDYWVHLKDYPGAHGIIHRNRNQQVPYGSLKSALLFVASESAHKFLSEGDRFDGVIAECRFVRPIKGDKLGRVTFKNEQVLTLTFAAQQ